MGRLRKCLFWKRRTTGADQQQRTRTNPTHRDKHSSRAESTAEPLFPDGVKVLHDCPGAMVDICFVHGLTGNRDTTWTADGQSTPWPKTLIPSKLPQARILTYGYDAYVMRRKEAVAKDRLTNHAKSLLKDLTDDRAGYGALSRPIFFVAHSLGGIVCKKAILLSRASSRDHIRSIFESTRGIIFMGTPHRGSWMADWAKIPARALSILKPTNPKLLDILQTDNELLRDIREGFAEMIQDKDHLINVTCFCEALPTHGNWLVVSQDSATLEGHELYTIHANHRDMVRFTSGDESGFKKLLGELVRWESEVTKPLAGQAEKLSVTQQPSVTESQKDSDNHHGSSTQHSGTFTNTGSPPAYNAQHQTIVGSTETIPNLVQDCQKALAFPQMETRFHDISRSTIGTCDWLFRHTVYQSWYNCNYGLLWIKGKPGSGKSTLLKYATDNHEASHDDLTLSFFFHGRGDELQRTPLGLFRSLLHQVLGQDPNSVQELIDAFSTKRERIGEPGEKWQWHQEELGRFFEASLLKVLEARSVWLFVDALDECGEEQAVDLTERFKSILANLPPTASKRLHICFSCRHYPDLNPDNTSEICLEDENRQSISIYVDTQLSELCRTAPSIPDTITRGASGLFLWAYLVVKLVRDRRRRAVPFRAIEAQIHSLPPDLDNLYGDIVLGMEDRSVSLRLIQWICFATRPLSLKELRWAMIVSADCSYQSFQECQRAEEFACDCNSVCHCDVMEKQVRTLSCGLAEVSVSSRAQVVQFIHQSVKDFFVEKGLSALTGTSSKNEAIGIAHYQLSRSCIRYLVMEEIAQSTSYTSKDFPFLHYATTSWVAHIKQCHDSGSVPQYDDIVELFAWPSNDVVELWVRVYGWVAPSSPKRPSNGTTLVHIASKYGFSGLLKAILQRPGQVSGSIDLKDRDGRTPLWFAAQNRHEAIFRLLLATNKVDPDSKDNLTGNTPLCLAAESGHDAIVELLLATGKINVDWKNNYSQTPLSQAAANGHEAVVKLLLNTGRVDIDSKDEYGQTPLYRAAENGNEATFKLLLAKIDFNSRDKYNRMLWWAAVNGNEAVVKLLADTGKVDIDLKGKDSQTPLLWAAGHEAVVRFLK